MIIEWANLKSRFWRWYITGSDKSLGHDTGGTAKMEQKK